MNLDNLPISGVMQVREGHFVNLVSLQTDYAGNKHILIKCKDCGEHYCIGCNAACPQCALRDEAIENMGEDA